MGLRRSVPGLLAAALLGLVSASAQAAPGAVFEGTLRLAHWDNFGAGRPSYAWDLRLDDGETLRVTGASPDATPGSRVRIHGVRDGQTLEAGGSAQTVQAAATQSAIGARKVAVLLVNFSDNASQPYTPDFARAIAFTNADSVAAYYAEDSWTQLTVTGDVYGWYTLPDASSACNYSQWATDATAAATAAGVSLTGYTNVVYAFPQVSAGGWS